MVQELANVVTDYVDVNRSRCFLHVVNLVAKRLLKQFDAIPNQSVANSARNNAEDNAENTARGTAENDDDNDVEENYEAGELDAELESDNWLELEEIIETMHEDSRNNSGGEDSDGEDSDGEDLDDPDDAPDSSVLSAEEQEALNVAVQPVRVVLAKVSCSASNMTCAHLQKTSSASYPSS